MQGVCPLSDNVPGLPKEATLSLCLQAKALVWQEQVEVLTQALQQANAEKAVLAADKGRLEQEVANLRLQMSVFQKAMEGGQLLPSSAPLAMSAPSGLPQPVSPVHPMVQQVSLTPFAAKSIRALLCKAQRGRLAWRS